MKGVNNDKRLTLATGLMLLATCTAQNTLQSTALKVLFDLSIPLSDLSSSERDTLSDLFESCETTTNVLSPFLDDALSAASKCADVAADKSTNDVISSADHQRLKTCTSDVRGFFRAHGGINILASPVLTEQNKTTLSDCADGVKSSYGHALELLVHRYTPCTITITEEQRADFAKIVPPNATSDAETSNQVSVRNVCNSLHNFEMLTRIVADFATNTINSFVDGMHSFTNNN